MRFLLHNIIYSHLAVLKIYSNELKKIIKRRKNADNLRKSGKQRKGQATTKTQPAFTHPISIQESGTQSSFTHSGSPEIPLEKQTDSVINPASENAEPDSHLARLLSSLTLSAVTSSENATRHKTRGDLVASHIMPVFDNSEGHPSVAPDPLSRLSSVPKNEEQLQDVLKCANSTFTSLSPHLGPQPSEENVAPIEHNTSRSTRTATPLAATSSTFSTSQTSRRVSSTADISPYLSRAAEIPTSAKRLQQLSLLESVADESARMAPIIAARAAMAGRGPIPNGYPQPPSSVPPHLLSNPSNLYSSYHPGPIPANLQSHYSSDALAQDHFQVRSRTSQAFHRAPTHNPTGSGSMNQNHLLAAINGSRLGPVSPNFQTGPQLMQQQRPPQVYNVGPPPLPPVSYFPPAMNGFPTPLPPLSSPHPSSNLNVPLGVASNNPTPVTLLSILNGRPYQQPPVPAQLHQ